MRATRAAARLLLAALACAPAGAAWPVREPADAALRGLERRFADLLGGDEGCFVLYDAREDRTLRINPAQCRRRLPPCSTFKVFNSLAGLQSGVVKDESTLFAWDGTAQPLPAWERDHTLATAVRDSVVWYFQRVAAGVGEAAMQRYLQASPAAEYIFATTVVGRSRPERLRGEGPDGLRARQISRALLAQPPPR